MSTLYIWGKPIATQLSTSHSPSPQLLSTNSPILNISCGTGHCVVVTEEGALGVGDNSEGQLGMRSVKNSGLTLAKIQLSFNCKIMEVSCGWHHTLLLDQGGNVFSSGRGDSGELGRQNFRSSSSFGFVLSGAHSISAGKDHSLALCGQKVLGWGNSKEGQLGLLIQKQYYRPQELNVYPCHRVLAAEKYSLFVTSKGVFGTGLNDQWQLGLGHSNSIQVPRKIAIQEDIIDLTSGSYNAACTSNKEWYLWGVGALGCYKYPTKMSFLSGADSVTIGPTAGIFSKKGRIWVWGNNSWGELGNQAEVSDYPVQSQEFCRMGLSGCRFGLNFLATFTNHQHCSRIKYSEENSCYDSDGCQSINIRRRNLLDSNSSDDLNKSPTFEHYNSIGDEKDYVRQFPHSLKCKLYTDQSSDYDDKCCGQTSYATLWNTQAQTPKGWLSKRYVKLINPVKSIYGGKKEELEKENKELRQQLQLQQFQKDKVEQEYMKRINCYDQQRVKNKLNKLENIANEQNRRPEKRQLFASSRKETESISFRPKIIEGNELQEMGEKIEALKGLLTNMVK